MSQGADWAEVEAPTPEGLPGGPSAGALPGDEEIRLLRDEVRRLREQVAALAARTKDDDRRIPTFVSGLDAALEGGGPRGHAGRGPRPPAPGARGRGGDPGRGPRAPGLPRAAEGPRAPRRRRDRL